MKNDESDSPLRESGAVHVDGISPLEAAVARFRALTVLDARCGDLILGYDDFGLPS
jgi:hypothetical protein